MPRIPKVVGRRQKLREDGIVETLELLRRSVPGTERVFTVAGLRKGKRESMSRRRLEAVWAELDASREG